MRSSLNDEKLPLVALTFARSASFIKRPNDARCKSTKVASLTFRFLFAREACKVADKVSSIHSVMRAVSSG